MKNTLASVAILLLVGGVVGTTLPAMAQTAAADSSASAFPDTPQNHWAYEAVQDLANKGLVKGYPDGKFLGNREMTRYEFATVIDRLLQTIEDMKAAPEPSAVAPQVTQDDLNKIQVLVDAFQTQLNAIQDNVTQAQNDIEALRQDVQDTKALVAKAQSTANSSYGYGSNRKFGISGYMQVRYDDALSGSKTQFPNGAPAQNSPYNGNYAQGGSRESVNIRRARLKFTGAPTSNTKYAVQIDVSGVVNPTVKVADPGSATAGTDVGTLSTSSSVIALKEANFTYTPGDGSATYPAITVGQFANPFGYILPLSSASIYSPDRPLAFNEGGTGLFNNEDYVRGAELSYGKGNIHLAGVVSDGNGYNSSNTTTAFEQIYRASYLSSNKILGLGVSYEQGPLNTGISAPTSGVIYTQTQKQLLGYDAQIILPSGPFVTGEYISGPFQQVTYFKSGAAGTSTAADPGNNVEGYYVQGGYTFHPKGNHPFTLVYSYDTLIRSQHSTGNLYKSLGALDDVNDSYGMMYNLDKATRLRFWYTDPESVAHIGANPPKVGLFITELQVKY